jgi:hypothetical protein
LRYPAALPVPGVIFPLMFVVFNVLRLPFG